MRRKGIIAMLVVAIVGVLALTGCGGRVGVCEECGRTDELRKFISKYTWVYLDGRELDDSGYLIEWVCPECWERLDNADV